MASYQDLESRVITLEDKLNFALNLIRVAHQSPLVGLPPTVVSLNDLYVESKRAGLEIIDIPKEDIENVSE